MKEGLKGTRKMKMLVKYKEEVYKAGGCKAAVNMAAGYNMVWKQPQWNWYQSRTTKMDNWN